MSSLAFLRVRKNRDCSLRHVRPSGPSVRMEQLCFQGTERILMESDIPVLLAEVFRGKLSFDYNLTRTASCLHKDFSN
jgi:hypothetical protein